CFNVVPMDYGMKNISASKSSLACCRRYKNCINLPTHLGDEPLYENDELRQKVGVRMVSVDEYLRSERSDVGFVKIDVQGYDCYVVKGMKETLSRSKNPMVIGELWPYGLRQAGSSADEYVLELSRLGFMVEVPSKERPKDWSLYAEDRGFYVDFIARRPNGGSQGSRHVRG
ncbi:MAG: FkbM family methyltransferase, partial [Deltaproteobacteria bacterium]|nr:FkbM family methyltransferase [Deltaproteobacteria bacterium]